MWFYCSYKLVIHKFVLTVNKILSVGRHIWRCKARLFVQSAIITNSIHGNDNSAHISVQDISSTIANMNNNIPPENNEGMLTEYDLEQQRDVNNRAINFFTCYCGKTCNGLRGLRPHQTSCHISNVDELKDLFTPENNFTQYDENSTAEENEVIQTEKVTIKEGIKLPKTDRDWNLANDYF